MYMCDICALRECDKAAGLCAICNDNMNHRSHFQVAPAAEVIIKSIGMSVEEYKNRIRNGGEVNDDDL